MAMDDLERMRADAHEMWARAERMQRASRAEAAQHGQQMAAWMVAYVTDAERSWGWFMERSHAMLAQLERYAAREAGAGDEDGHG